MEGGRFRWRRRCSAGGGDIANVPSPTAPTSCGAHSRRIDNLALSSPGPATEPFDSLIKSTYMGVDRASGCNPLLAYATDPSTRPTRQPTAGDKKEAETRKKSKQLSRYANVLLSAGGWGVSAFFFSVGFFCTAFRLFWDDLRASCVSARCTWWYSPGLSGAIGCRYHRFAGGGGVVAKINQNKKKTRTTRTGPVTRF